MTLFALETSRAAAGAWTVPEGETKGIATIAYSFASDAFDESGAGVPVQSFEKYELRGYVEYGWTDGITLVAQPAWRIKSQGDEKESGIGRIDLGIRGRLWHDEVSVISAEVTGSIPGAGDSLAPLDGEDSEIEVGAKLQYGRGFTLFERNGFVDVQTGYRHRLEDPADEARFDVTFGFDIDPETLVMVQSFNAVSVGTARGVFEDAQDHQVSFSTLYRVSDSFGVQVGATATVYGRNVLREQGAFVGFWGSF